METLKRKAKILNEITEALKEWGKYNQADENTRKSPDARQATKNAIELLLDNLGLLNKIREEYGCHGPLQCLFDHLSDLASKRDKPNVDLGAHWCWGDNFTQPKLSGGVNVSFLDECLRWTSLVRAEVKGSQKTNRTPSSGNKPQGRDGRGDATSEQTKETKDNSAAKKKWTPPKGWTGSNCIVNSTIADLKTRLKLPPKQGDETPKMPRSTLADRAKQDKKAGGLLDGVTLEQDPVTHEVYYPNSWLKKVLRDYKPRPPKP